MEGRLRQYRMWIKCGNPFLGNTDMIKNVYSKAKKHQLLKRDTRWTLVFEDFNSDTFDLNELEDQTNVLRMTDDSCCKLLNKGKRNMKFDHLSCIFHTSNHSYNKMNKL